jgi:hypothetical protein
VKNTATITTLVLFSFGWSQNMNPSKMFFSQLPQEIQDRLSQSRASWGQAPSRPITPSSRDAEDLYGEWEHEDDNANLWVTSGTDQTIPNPAQAQGLEPADGYIIIDGSTNGNMNYMFALVGMYYSDAIQLWLGNNPIIDIEGYSYFEGDTISDDVVLPYYQMEYVSVPSYNFSGGELLVIDTINGEIVEEWYVIENVGNQITIDSISLRLEIDDLTVYSDDGDSNYCVLSGSLSPGTLDIEAGVETEIIFPLFTSDFGPEIGDESMIWQLFSDSTGLEIISGDDYYDSWSDTTELQWSANDDSMTIVFLFWDDYYYEEDSDTMTFAYSVASGTLSINATMDLCEMMDDDYYYGDCYEMLSMFLGIEDIQEALIGFDMTMSYVEELAVLENGIVPETVHLYSNYPNPFNPVTTIRFDIPAETQHPISLLVYDIGGRMVETLVNKKLEPGQHEIQWNASQHSSGVYFLRMNAVSFTKTQKMILLK